MKATCGCCAAAVAFRCGLCLVAVAGLDCNCRCQEPLRAARCRSCDVPILWCEVTRAGGKSGRMPVDAEPVPMGNVFVEQRRGTLLATVSKGPVEHGRMAHHATCPQAKEWKQLSRRTP